MRVEAQLIDQISLSGYGTDELLIFIKYGGPDHNGMLNGVGDKDQSFGRNGNGVDIRF